MVLSFYIILSCYLLLNIILNFANSHKFFAFVIIFLFSNMFRSVFWVWSILT